MRPILLAGGLISAGMLFGGCGDSSAMKNYSVTLTNLTYAQPMSPMAAVVHTDGYHLFRVGSEASDGVEHLAEGGDNSAVLSAANADGAVEAAVGGNGLILPGASDTVMLDSHSSGCLSLATMLVNANDAFAGADCIDVDALKKGEVMTIYLSAYDAGTEANSETAATIPGPAGGGEGYNSERDDRNFVSIHGGVVTVDDGLAGSALSERHRWNNPVAILKIERSQ